jgi:hypothetical protein
MTKKSVAVPIGIDKATNEIRSICDLDKSQVGLMCNFTCPNEKCASDLLAIFSQTGKSVDYLKHHN